MKNTQLKFVQMDQKNFDEFLALYLQIFGLYSKDNFIGYFLHMPASIGLANQDRLSQLEKEKPDMHQIILEYINSVSPKPQEETFINWSQLGFDIFRVRGLELKGKLVGVIAYSQELPKSLSMDSDNTPVKVEFFGLLPEFLYLEDWFFLAFLGSIKAHTGVTFTISQYVKLSLAKFGFNEQNGIFSFSSFPRFSRYLLSCNDAGENGSDVHRSASNPEFIFGQRTLLHSGGTSRGVILNKTTLVRERFFLLPSVLLKVLPYV